MFSLTPSRMSLIALTAVATILVSPASAITGREAVGKCIDSTATGARCGWAVSKDGSIDVCNKSGCVTCPSAEGQCTAAKRGKPRPKFGLPSGTEISTAIGSFKVK